ncbi:MAG TPA: hypothetical protein VGG39_12770 [Polyangiaceae bacterium]|jgi:hypothetical protein
MAHPADTGPQAPGAFAHGRLSPDDADRLATMFRPSWELDDAPFTGPGTLEPSEIRALQGGGVHADVRETAQSTAYSSNGSHALPAAQPSHEPEDSVVIDRSITAQDLAPPPGPRPVPMKGTGTILGMAAPAPQAAPPPAQAVAQAPPPAPIQSKPPPVPSRPPPSQRPKAPQFTVGPPTPAKAKPVSIDLEVGYPKKSRTPLYAALGGAGVLVLGLIVWGVSSSGSNDKAAAPVPTATATVEDKAASIPPPPPATTTQAAAAPTVAAAPPPATTTAAPAPVPVPIPQTPVAALPMAAPVPTHAPAAYTPPRSYGAPAARPAGRGKATIVRDVPF